MTTARTATISLFGAVLIHAAAAGIAVGVLTFFPGDQTLPSGPMESIVSDAMMVRLEQALREEPPADAGEEDAPTGPAPVEPMEPQPPTDMAPPPTPTAEETPPAPEPPPADSTPVSVPDSPAQATAPPPPKEEPTARPRPVPKPAAKPKPVTRTDSSPPRSGTAATVPRAGTGAPRTAAQTGGGYQNAGTASYVRRGSAAYPAEARRKRQSGTVRLMLYVSAAGTVDRVEVIRSSGHPLLDAAAVRAESRSRLNPARKNGVAVPSRAVTECRFVLE